MRYEDAAKIGTNVEGYVRCTYVRLHDLNDGHLYSLQHHDAWKLTDAHLQATQTLGAASEKVTQDVIERNTDYSEFVEDIPVVKAIRPYNVFGKGVEVQLTDYARDLLYRKANADYRTETKYYVEKVQVRDHVMQDGTVLAHAGERRTMLETYDPEQLKSFAELRYDRPERLGELKATNPILYKKIWDAGYCYAVSTRTGNELNRGRMENMEFLLSKDATFVVKEVAIDWFPTNIKGAWIIDPKTGKLVSIDVALDAAKKKYIQK